MDDSEGKGSRLGYEVRRVKPPLPCEWSSGAAADRLFVTRKTNLPALLEEVEKRMADGCKEVLILGLGVAINRAINLALQLERKSLGLVQLSVNTSSVEVTDELKPLLDDCDLTVRQRNVSAVAIRVFSDCRV